MYRVWNFLTNYSLLLIIGALIALVWANTDAHSYHHLVEYPVWFNDWVGLDYDYWKKVYGKGYDAFGAPGYVRLSFATSMDVIESGLDALEQFLSS